MELALDWWQSVGGIGFGFVVHAGKIAAGKSVGLMRKMY